MDAGSQITFTHNLGVIPSLAFLDVVFKRDDYGYKTGDRVRFSFGAASGSTVIRSSSRRQPPLSRSVRRYHSADLRNN